MTFQELAKARFSVRQFSNQMVEPILLQKILEAGQLAPTAKNNQPQRIYVLQRPEVLEKLDSVTHCRYGAKTVLVFTYNQQEDWKNPLEAGIHSGVEDTSIVATYVMLQAIELGIYSTWCNYFSNTELAQVLDLPDDEKVVLIMPIGYKKEDVQPTEAHSQSKDLQALVTYLV